MKFEIIFIYLFGLQCIKEMFVCCEKALNDREGNKKEIKRGDKKERNLMFVCCEKALNSKDIIFSKCGNQRFIEGL